jgi:cystathionine beta-lyase/cystathionine gamma-synthase
MIVDNTIASPWGMRRPLLSHEGIDVVTASGTKALGGQDRDLWGYIASNRIDLLNEIMDIEATRGGTLDWRRAQAIVEGLAGAAQSYERRCETAGRVAAFLDAHPRVSEAFHPSLPGHVDAAIIRQHYRRSGSLLSFRVKGLDEDGTRHFADVLATCTVPRYALSFDGLTTKLNHHRTVSEYFTPIEELVRCGFDRLVRLGIGLEHPDDLIACLNWALWHHQDVGPEAVLAWQKGRECELGIYGATRKGQAFSNAPGGHPDLQEKAGPAQDVQARLARPDCEKPPKSN